MKKLSVLILFLLIAFTPDLFAQCPMCKTAVTSGLESGKTSVGLGLNDGILYLLAAPYLLVGTVGFFWWKNRKKKSLVK